MKHLNRNVLLSTFICMFIFMNGVFFNGLIRADEKQKFDIHGYISQGFLLSTGNNYTTGAKKGTFQFNELGLHFSTNLHDKLRVGVQLAARDFGDTGNDDVIVDWAFGDYRWKDWLGIRAGKIKMRLGLYNESRDLDMLRTAIFLPQGIYNESYREAVTALKGVSIYGNLPLKSLGNLAYRFLVGNQNVAHDGSTAKAIEATSPINIDKIEAETAYNWSIFWEPPLEGLRVGYSQVSTKLDIAASLANDIVVSVDFPPYELVIAPMGTPITLTSPSLKYMVASLEYTWKNLVLAAEYSLLKFHLISKIPGLEPILERIPSESFYISASYRFNDWLEAGAYYMEFYRDKNDRKGLTFPNGPPERGFQKQTTLSLSFDINHHWFFKLEGHIINGVGLIYPQDNLNSLGIPEFKRNWVLFAAKMTFSF